MKILNLLPVFSLLFFVACGDDASSVNRVDPETSSSSEELTETSSSFEKGKSSSSKAKVSSSSKKESRSSSSADVEESSSSAKSNSSSSSGKSNSSSSSSKKSSKSSSSSVVKNSSSSADVVLTDPMKIFKTRTPKAAVRQCSFEEKIGKESIKWDMDFDQQDWICTFKYADLEGFVYVQGSPTDCQKVGMGMNPEISVDTAVLYVNGKYETLSAVSYEWGGNHHNDKFRFAYDGKVYEYFHSSYGWGGRSCQEMDCIRVFESDGTTLIEDGCKTFDEDLSEVRSLPVVCRFASLEDGSFGDFTDTFELCNGDFRLDMDQE